MDLKVDKSFMQQLSQGDEKSFDKLFMDKHQQVYGYCLKLIKFEEAAEEIVHDVFLTIWKKRNQLDPHLSLDALLYKITRDLSFNYLKKATRESKFRLELKAQSCQSLTNFTEDQVLYDEYFKIADAALNQLPPQRRQIFTMSRRMGMSYDEIADQLGISKNTVKVQLVRASKFLKEYFATHADITLLLFIGLFFQDTFF